MATIKEQVNAEAQKVEDAAKAAVKAEVAKNPWTSIVIAAVLGAVAIVAAIVLLHG
jgi:ElaB/YqjD/DUF883 family membrane-anchored ribosome-binding protein